MINNLYFAIFSYFQMTTKKQMMRSMHQANLVQSRMMSCKFVLDYFWRIIIIVRHVLNINNRWIHLDRVTRVHCQHWRIHRKLTCLKGHTEINHRLLDAVVNQLDLYCLFLFLRTAMHLQTRWDDVIPLLVSSQWLFMTIKLLIDAF